MLLVLHNNLKTPTAGGAFFDYPHVKRKSQKEIEEERERLGITVKKAKEIKSAVIQAIPKDLTNDIDVRSTVQEVRSSIKQAEKDDAGVMIYINLLLEAEIDKRKKAAKLIEQEDEEISDLSMIILFLH